MTRNVAAGLVTVAHALAAAGVGAQPSLLWGEQFGTPVNDWNEGLASDGEGGVFIAGSTAGNLAGPNAGGYDAWAARHDHEGSRLWIVQFGTISDDQFWDAAPDGAGGVLLAGSTQGDLGGPNMGGPDCFLARYGGDGARGWLVQFGTVAADVASAVVPADDGGALVAGVTRGDLGGPNAGELDIWLAEFDSAGERQWVMQFGSSENDVVSSIASDGTGGFFIAGYTYGSLGGPYAGGQDAWLARVDGGGEPSWIVQLGTAEADWAEALAPDGTGGVFIAGYSFGSLGGPNAGATDAWLARYDGSGAQEWITQFGTSAHDQAYALGPADGGAVQIAGHTGGELGGPQAGKGDGWLARYDGEGVRAWITQFGSKQSDVAGALATDGAGGWFISGLTQGGLFGDFQGGEYDIFLARFGEACYPDFTGDGVLDLFDFLGYVNTFNAGDEAADCDGNGPLDLFDFLCFVNAFNAGC